MRDVMIDVENLSVEPNGPVLTIGMCLFDIRTGEIGPEFYERMDRTKAQIYGTPSLSTLAWWEGQAEDVRAEAYNGTSDPKDVARSLRQWFDKYDLTRKVRVWGNGSVMDIAQLEWWLRQTNPVMGRYGHEYPWAYWDIMDMRTIMMLAGLRMPRSRPEWMDHHNALHDARYQVEWVSNAYRTIKKIPAIAAHSGVAKLANAPVINLPPDVPLNITAD